MVAKSRAAVRLASGGKTIPVSTGCRDAVNPSSE
jgi:hypothetical protein